MKQLNLITEKLVNASSLIPSIPISSLLVRLLVGMGKLRSNRLRPRSLGLIALISFGPVLSAATVDDLTFTLINEDMEYAVTDSADTATGTLTIPDTYEGLPVTEIGANAFYQSQLTAIELPSGLRTIESYAFYGSALESLSLPAGLTALGANAFDNCSSLTGSVTIPSGITEIPSGLFHGTDLTEVILHDALTSIGAFAFQETKISGINLPSSLMTIGESAFRNTALESLSLPAGLTALGANAFHECSSLTGSVTIPSGITEISDFLFYDTDLTEIILHDAVTSIGIRSFFRVNITTINLPSSLRTISYAAFSRSALQSISLPAGLTDLGTNVFDNCSSLTGSVTIPSGITEISDSLFYNTALTEVILHDAVTSIRKRAFYLTDISSINLPSSLRTIGERAFSNSQLTSINLPEGLTALASNAFSACYSLTGSVTIPSGITEIPDFLFWRTPLTEVILHDGVTSIGDQAFAYTNISTINLPSSLTTLGALALSNSDLQSITLPASLLSLGHRALENTYSLAEVRLEGAAPSLGTDVFNNVGRDVAEGTQLFIQYEHQASYDNSADWSGFTFTVLGEPNEPMIEAFVLSTSLDASSTVFSIHSHGEPSDASASVLVQHRSSLTEGEWVAVDSADVAESRDTETGVVTRSLSLSPSAEDSFYRLHYTASQ